MPRPKTVSDETVLTAALELLAEVGWNFTLSDLARRVGLSRATLIQRFGDRDSILRHMAEHEVEVTRNWIGSFPIERGERPLWHFLEEIVESMGAGDGFTARVQIAALEVGDPLLKTLAHQRYSIVQDAIAARLPDAPSSRATAEVLHAVIAGATMQWVVTDGSTGLSEFVLQRLRCAFDSLRPHLT